MKGGYWKGEGWEGGMEGRRLGGGYGREKVVRSVWERRLGGGYGKGEGRGIGKEKAVRSVWERRRLGGEV